MFSLVSLIISAHRPTQLGRDAGTNSLLIHCVLPLLVHSQLPDGERQPEYVQAGRYEAVVGDLRVGLLQMLFGHIGIGSVGNIFNQRDGVDSEEDAE